MRVYIVDVMIPLDLLQPWQASAEIESDLGPCDTGAGFGWRDIEIQSESEEDQKHVVERATNILQSHGYDVLVDGENAWGRHQAYIRTRSVDPEEDRHDEEMSITHGLIPPGYEE